MAISLRTKAGLTLVPPMDGTQIEVPENGFWNRIVKAETISADLGEGYDTFYRENSAAVIQYVNTALNDKDISGLAVFAREICWDGSGQLVSIEAVAFFEKDNGDGDRCYCRSFRM